MRRLSITTLAVLVCASTGACASGRLELRTLEQDERDVLLAVIRYMQTEEGGEPAPVLAALSMEITAEDAHLLPDAEVLEEAVEVEEIEGRFPLEVFPDLLRRNHARVPLARLIGDGAGVRWITQAQEDSLESARSRELTAEMRLLGQMFPGAESINWLSRPGFDEPRRHASVAYAWNCGDLCGAAGVYLLERRSGRWHVRDRMAMMVS